MRLFITLSVCFFLFSFMDLKQSYTVKYQPTRKAEALHILEQKCNTCHIKKKQILFTEKNMTSQARPIYYQVFEKKRMPKGKKVKLTEQERKSLRIWLVEDCGVLKQ